MKTFLIKTCQCLSYFVFKSSFFFFLWLNRWLYNGSFQSKEIFSFFGGLIFWRMSHAWAKIHDFDICIYVYFNNNNIISYRFFSILLPGFLNWVLKTMKNSCLHSRSICWPSFFWITLFFAATWCVFFFQATIVVVVVIIIIS